jgi:hypothetical protein
VANRYITLKTADGISMNKRFRVVEGGYQKQSIKSGVMKRTIGGKIDMHSGSVLDVLPLIIKVRHTEEESSYGTLSDLEYLFGLNDPTDPNTPDRLTMIDHYGEVKFVYLWDEMLGVPLSTQIDGIYAWFHHQVMIIIEPEE